MGLFPEMKQISVFTPYHLKFIENCKGKVKLKEIFSMDGINAYEMTSELQKDKAFAIRRKIYDHDKEIQKLEKKK